jgi:hypothetical protein
MEFNLNAKPKAEARDLHLGENYGRLQWDRIKKLI